MSEQLSGKADEDIYGAFIELVDTAITVANQMFLEHGTDYHHGGEGYLKHLRLNLMQRQLGAQVAAQETEADGN